jgi:TRAP-type mannitol/chloroaromatic compound transport system substrate-binding protein
LPEDLQEIVRLACSATNDQMTAEFVARNAMSLKQLRNEGEIEILPFPEDVLSGLRQISEEVVQEVISRDADAARIYESFSAYRDTVADWIDISERAMLRTRSG